MSKNEKRLFIRGDLKQKNKGKHINYFNLFDNKQPLYYNIQR